ncbi:MAG: tetratricopeptide repeat protein [Rhodospirillales bacterium]|nr:tetratricopeptide repeat protein [Rhodospirillales bacterium]
MREALARIVESAEFVRSPRLQRFLRFVVEEALAGRGNALKEYAIAIEVFDRDSSYDPQTNSLVRVEASRLRAKLEKYNAIDGRDEPVHISLPAGSYMPAFHAVLGEPSWATREGATIRSRRLIPLRTALIAVAAMATTGIAAFIYLENVDRRGPGAPTAATEQKRIHTIAVLPLRNLSGDPDEDYLSDSMTDALITSLAKQQSVRVISLTSAMAYKNANRPIAEIARDLNVSHVVEGSILRSSGSVRITAQLIDVATDRYLWAESYERGATEVLALQSEVARRIVASLSSVVGSGVVEVKAATPAVDTEAQEAYLRGRYFQNQLTEDGFRKGVAYFKQAISQAPKFAEAYSGMAACYCLLGGHGFELVDPREGMPAAKSAVLEALNLDDSLAEPHAFLGIIRLKYEWDWAGAEEAFQHAIRLNPSYAQAHNFYSFFLEAMGRHAEAIREAEAARALDPLSLPVNVNLVWQYLRAHKLEHALRHLEKTRELQADFWGVQWGFGHYHRQKGEYDAAIAAFERAVQIGGGHALPITDLGYTYAIAGRSADARRMLDRLKTMAEGGYVSPYNMATIHVGLGEVDEAFDWLEEALETRSRSLAWLKVSSEYDGLRADPRLKSLLKRVGLPE